MFRYLEEDDFGQPENAFLVCAFWYIRALRALRQWEEARALFERMLAGRNRLGLLAEHIDPHNREQTGNFVQTYSMVGLIDAATRLSPSLPTSRPRTRAVRTMNHLSNDVWSRYAP